ncbi:hypothetical protein PIB30_017405 [Stylosanthes scabra]|uniref:Uncharacterized protein n=1 Tax=Stylosanthes scabra TaxID=79078 RepID=A0ABU6WAP3_9FABA|nr:hypothetical protein [Stylosanthes scabra]
MVRNSLKGFETSWVENRVGPAIRSEMHENRSTPFIPCASVCSSLSHHSSFTSTNSQSAATQPFVASRSSEPPVSVLCWLRRARLQPFFASPSSGGGPCVLARCYFCR